MPVYFTNPIPHSTACIRPLPVGCSLRFMRLAAAAGLGLHYSAARPPANRTFPPPAGPPHYYCYHGPILFCPFARRFLTSYSFPARLHHTFYSLPRTRGARRLVQLFPPATPACSCLPVSASAATTTTLPPARVPQFISGRASNPSASTNAPAGGGTRCTRHPDRTSHTCAAHWRRLPRGTRFTSEQDGHSVTRRGCLRWTLWTKQLRFWRATARITRATTLNGTDYI